MKCWNKIVITTVFILTGNQAQHEDGKFNSGITEKHIWFYSIKGYHQK